MSQTCPGCGKPVERTKKQGAKKWCNKSCRILAAKIRAGWQPAEPKRSDYEQIAATIRGDMTITQLAQAAGWPMQRTSNAVHNARERGLLECVGKLPGHAGQGIYRIAAPRSKITLEQCWPMPIPQAEARV